MKVEKKLRIGHMPYLNSEIFYINLLPGLWDLSKAYPRQMSKLVISGDLDCGPLPVVEIFELEDILSPLDNFGISSNGPANSVCLFSNLPIKELRGKNISLTSQSSTSVKLLKLLFSTCWDILDIQYVDESYPHDAILLIGDNALRQKKNLSYRYVFDLAEVWKQMTDKPFVFARWVYRKDSDEKLVNKFSESLSFSVKQSYAQSFQNIMNKRSSIYMNENEVKEYVSSFVYMLGDNELEGMNLFRQMLAQNSII